MMKLRTSRPRFMPTARSMPSSGFRSSASITKMFTSSSTPAMIEKLPMNRNSEPRPLPACTAALSTPCLGFSTDVPWLASGPSAVFSLAATASLRLSPDSTPPVLDTNENVCGSAAAAPGPPDRGRPAVQVEGEHVPLPCPHRLGQVGVDDRLAGARRGAGEARPAVGGAAEGGRLREVDLPDARARLGRAPAAAAAGDGGLVAAQRQDPVDVRVAPEALDPAGGLVTLGDRGRADDLVDRPEVLVGNLLDGEVEGVADDEAAGDDRGAEHRPHDHQGRLAAAPGDLPQRELAQERPAHRDERRDGERRPE